MDIPIEFDEARYEQYCDRCQKQIERSSWRDDDQHAVVRIAKSNYGYIEICRDCFEEVISILFAPTASGEKKRKEREERDEKERTGELEKEEARKKKENAKKAKKLRTLQQAQRRIKKLEKEVEVLKRG